MLGGIRQAVLEVPSAITSEASAALGVVTYEETGLEYLSRAAITNAMPSGAVVNIRRSTNDKETPEALPGQEQLSAAHASTNCVPTVIMLSW